MQWKSISNDWWYMQINGYTVAKIYKGFFPEHSYRFQILGGDWTLLPERECQSEDELILKHMRYVEATIKDIVRWSLHLTTMKTDITIVRF